MNEATLKALRRALDSANRHERAEAAIALGHLGDANSEPRLALLAEGDDGLVAAAAIFARHLLTGEVAGVERLVALAAGEDEETTQLAVEATVQMGAEAAPALETLCREGGELARTAGRLLEELEEPE